MQDRRLAKRTIKDDKWFLEIAKTILLSHAMFMIQVKAQTKLINGITEMRLQEVPIVKVAVHSASETCNDKR